ncbi:hypothetical protein NDS46_30420 (plasmid) [Paenibacillus thiaminolyticus]|uniref:hypothetical protein n=1 Tax=Paenibacillus thiaminolyticus TaxID=49283 RepID=UPI00232EAC91|nr:hypothetical protein [Paenibacillus thiaminolyticus]WCF11664.1 hypothetical protein NDS46_30420 [Paenibacillus thiaminolyticus]
MLKLVSNFIDYYDHYFDLQGDVLRRLSNEGMNRVEMLQFLQQKNLTVPLHGIVKNLQNHSLIERDTYVIVHTDIHSHRGENKHLLLYRDALERYPDELMVLYVSSFQGCSWRYLKIGSRSFILHYQSKDWRSNWDTEKITIEDENASLINIDVNEPLFAIDFVKNINENGEAVMMAIDYNIAPQLKGTGIENILAPAEVANLIKESWMRSQKTMW